MTDFVRIPGKIFAENASPVGNDPQIGKFGNAKQGIYTGEADVQEIQNSDAWSQGWTSAVVSAMNFPPLPEMNGVLKVLSYQICYLLQKGIPEWNADTIYYTNDYVNYNGKLYYSSIDNNTYEPETPGAGNSWLSGTSDVAIATLDKNGISRPDGETLTITNDGVLSIKNSQTAFSLFESKYSEYPLYNASWLLSEGQYNPASIYPTAYEALVIEQDITKEVGQSYELSSGGSYTKRGLSVKLSSDEGITEYDFVLNTEEQSFRLPILNGSETLPGEYSDYVQKTWKQDFIVPYNSMIYGGAYSDSTTSDGVISAISSDGTKHTLLAHDDGYIHTHLPIVKAGTKIQTTGGTGYQGIYYYKCYGNGQLYYYVGETVQNANLIDVGRILENLANKTTQEQAAIATMPSSRHINLTLGASESIMVAPETGWVYLSKAVTAAGQYTRLENKTAGIAINFNSPNGTSTIKSYLPVTKGDEFFVRYSAAGATDAFRFVYANGVK